MQVDIPIVLSLKKKKKNLPKKLCDTIPDVYLNNGYSPLWEMYPESLFLMFYSVTKFFH